MKLFIEASTLNKGFQGTYTFVLEIIKSFSTRFSKDIKLYVGVDSIDKNIIQLQNKFDLTIIKYNSKNKLIKINLEIPNILKKHKIFNAIFQYYIPFLNFNNCSYYPVIHDVLFLDFKKYFSVNYSIIRFLVFGISARLSKNILTVSNYSKRRIIKHFFVNKSKVIVVPNGVSRDIIDFNSSKKASINHIKKKFNISNYILYVSRFEKRKNHEFLIKNKFLFADKKLVFIGAKKNISTKLSNLIFSDSDIFHLEGVSQDDLNHFYNASTFFIYPSNAEGFGIPPLEAACLNVPVLCAQNTAMDDFKFFKSTMFKNNSESLKNALNNLSADPKKLNIIKTEIISKYSWDNSTSIIHKLINTNAK